MVINTFTDMILALFLRYTGLIDPNSYPYSINPCTPFSASGECTNVFVSDEKAASLFSPTYLHNYYL